MDAELSIHAAYAGALFVLGLAAGSFLNVVIYRAPRNMSLVYPPSSCPSCGRRIAGRDNIPVLGWLMLGGRCRSCRRPISWRYPGVELLTGVLWAAEGWRIAGFRFGHYADVFLGMLELLLVSALVATIVIDIDHRIILDEISVGGAVVAVAASPLLPALHRADAPL